MGPASTDPELSRRRRGRVFYWTPPVSRRTQGLTTSAKTPAPALTIATFRKRTAGVMASMLPATRPANRLPNAVPMNQIPII